jgi:predicted unusual protein kinase regulating ubiquinone biosynthesis (AarF/ABC1/UbiB family)
MCSYIYVEQNISYFFHRNINKYYENLINKVSSLDIFFIKILQWVVGDGKNERLNDLLINYSNNVTYNDEDIDIISLLNLEKNYDISINKKPINSGTIAIVFEGIYKNNKIIIKTKRKNIKKKLEYSISLINFLSNILNLIPNFNTIKLNKIIHSNTKNLIQQIDFNYEKNNLKLFYSYFKDNNEIYTPSIYEELSNFDILVMEYLDGWTIHNYVSSYKDYSIFVNVYDFFLTSILDYNIIHSDLHKGNVLFLKKGGIGIIDFGLVKIISNKEKNILLEYLLGLFSSFKKFKIVILTKLVEKIDKTLHVDYETLQNNLEFEEFVKKLVHSNAIKFFEIDIFLKKYNLKIQKDMFNILIDVAPFVDFCRYMSNTYKSNITKKALMKYKKKVIYDQLK